MLEIAYDHGLWIDRVHLKITLAVTKLFNPNSCVLTTGTKVIRVIWARIFGSSSKSHF